MDTLIGNRIDSLSRTIVITGGAGYIGSVIAHHLVDMGYVVVVIDKKPLPIALRSCGSLFFFQGDCADPIVWDSIASQFTCDIVIHLAAFIEVGESVLRPAEYYDNNVAKLIAMMNCIRHSGIRGIIAASSSAVYGNPHELPTPEHHQRTPLSPYGRTKVMLEDILVDYHHAYGFNVALLRFANVSGGLPAYGLGECHEPEAHLIPRLINAVHQGQSFLLYGTDHATPDGTCMRDFVHVYDVARLHGLLLSLFCEREHLSPVVLNVGSGVGTSVQQMISHVSATMDKHIVVEEMPRRVGDAPYIVLDIRAAHELVGWQPIASDIKNIVTSAYHFHKWHSSPLSLSEITK